MGDILQGTTFSAGQLVTADSLNKLVGDAQLKDGSVVAGNLSADVINNIIKGQTTISADDLSSEDWLLIWDESDGAFKKVKKADIGGVVMSEGLNLTETTATTAIDLRGNTAISFLLQSDHLSISENGIVFMDEDKPIVFGGMVSMQYVPTSNSLRIFPVSEDSPTGEKRLDLDFNTIDITARQASTNATLSIGGRDADESDGTVVANRWYLVSSGTNPELMIAPTDLMTDRDNSDPDYQEPRIVLRGDVYVTDFDDIKVLPVQTDSTKSKLFVDELYNTDGEALITDGAVTASGLNLQADSLQVNDQGNLDIKVNPSGGLESTGAGLQLATSEEALLAILIINQTNGVAYTKGQTHIDRIGTRVEDKFINMTECYRWIRDNVASLRVLVQIIHETDCVEPNYATYGIRTTASGTPEVQHYSLDIYNSLTQSDYSSTATHNRIAENSELPRVFFTASNTQPYANRAVLWFEHMVQFRGIHFVCNMGTSQDHFCAIRSRKDDMVFTFCKLTLSSSSFLSEVFNIIDGGSLRFTCDGFHSGFTGHIDIDDPYRRGVSTRAPALEFDGNGVVGGIGSFLRSGINTKFECTEFRPASLVDSRYSRLHFSGNGTTTFTASLFTLNKFSSFIFNSPLTVGSDLTLGLSGVNAFHTSQYNGISFTPTDGNYQAFPASQAIRSADVSGADYILNVDFHASDRTQGPIATTSALETVDDYY